MAMKAWHTVITPREDLRDGRPLDAAEFAVHLDKVRDGHAPVVYQDPEAFFTRTFLTNNLTGLAAEVARRLNGMQTETSAVFNLATQFGGGKTHALTLLYHMAQRGVNAQTPWPGVQAILQRAGVSVVPQAAVAVFVGTEFDSITGRGGTDGTPLRRTPWGEIAWQLGGAEAFARVAVHDQQSIAPGGDVIRAMLPRDRPCLILMDELLNYVSRFRKIGMSAQFYDFLQNLSETARGLTNVVLAASIPASALEMSPDDYADHERFKHLLNRVGKAFILSGETETSEIIRRRLFEWDLSLLGQNGRVILPKDARDTCRDYAYWVNDHRQQLPQWFSADHAEAAFVATYPFHPSVLSVFERKWRSLPRFQQTRGVLRMLALWVSNAYSEGYRRSNRDALIGLGSAPLDDPLFRAAVLEQVGEQPRLEGVITTDICGKQDAHAIRLDMEATEVLRKARLHRKVATSIFFESEGGAASRAYATVPELRLAVAEPGLDIGNIETALEALSTSCYYLTAEANQYRYGLTPNLNKLIADRRATIQQQEIERQVRDEIEKVFKGSNGVDRIFFPEKSNDIPDRAALTLAIVAPEIALASSAETQARLLAMTRDYGASSRKYKNALIWCVPETATGLYEEARKTLAWESIDPNQDLPRGDEGEAARRQLRESLDRARRDLQASVWRSYRRLLLFNRDNALTPFDLGQMNSSGGFLVSQILQQLQQRDELTASVGAAFLARYWPPAFTEWSTRKVRDDFYASPRFPRLLRADIVTETIARGVSDGVIAYVVKGAGDEYAQLRFNTPLMASEVEISDDAFIITAEIAKAYLADQEARAAQRNADTVSQTPPPAVQPEGGTLYIGGQQPNEHIAEQPDAGASFVPSTITATAGKLTWNGSIPPQKWMTFYTKVLTGLVNTGELRLALTVEATPSGGLTSQRVEAVKAALRELGLPDGIQVE